MCTAIKLQQIFEQTVVFFAGVDGFGGYFVCFLMDAYHRVYFPSFS